MEKLSTEYALHVLRLKKIEEKKYSPSSECSPRMAYVFHDDEE